MRAPTGCPACGSAATAAAWTAGDRLFRTTDETFTMRRCDRCRVFFLAPSPRAEDLPRYYPETYWTPPDPAAAPDGLHRRLTERYRRSVLRDHVRFLAAVVADQRARGIPVHILDAGCGDGSLLAALGDGPAVALDGSPDAVRAARARGLLTVRGGVAAPPFRSGSFSLVTLFHVLEHVADPGPPLRAAHALLRDGGDLVVQVPNAASRQAAWLGARWSGFDVPRHLVSYPPEALRDVLARHGFAVVREHRRFLRDDTALFASSLVPRLYPPARAGGRAGGAAWIADLAYLAVTAATLPLVLLASAGGRGATVMVQARRI